MQEDKQGNLAYTLTDTYGHHSAPREIQRYNGHNDVINGRDDVTICDNYVIAEDGDPVKKNGYQAAFHQVGYGYVGNDVTGCDVICERDYIQIDGCERDVDGLAYGARKRTRIFGKLCSCHGNYPKFFRRKNGLSGWMTTIAIMFSFLLLMPSTSHADYYSDYVSLIMKNQTKSACDGEYLRIDCPEGTSIHVLRAMYGRKVPSSEMCPGEGGAGGGSGKMEEDLNCEAKTATECEDHRICRLLVHRRVFGEDPCPETNKYLTVQYTCAPGDFRQQSSCMEQNVKFRCRQDTVISIYDVILSESPACEDKVNLKTCTMISEEVLDEVSTRCHAREKCSYSLPTASCYNHVEIIHSCVPKELLTSELPSSVRLLPTTVTSQTTTTHSTTEATTTVQSTVTTTINHKGESTFSPTTATSTSTTELTTKFLVEPPLIDVSDNLTASTASNYDATTKFTNFTTTHRPIDDDDDDDAISRNNKNNHSESDITIHNEFPMPPKDSGMELLNSSTGTAVLCINCSTAGEGRNTFMILITNLYEFVQENSQDLIIAVLLGVCIALLLTILVLVLPCRLKRVKKTKGTRTTTAESRPSVEEEEEYRLPAPLLQEETDEHENMSLLGSILQRSVSSSNTVHHQINSNNTKPKPLGEPETNEESKSRCGPDSIFGKICCTCCCSNPPWQRTRILKRHRGGVYRVPRRYSSSQDDDEVEGRDHGNSQDPFPVFSRGDGSESRSPGPTLEDHMNRTEYPIVTSAPHHHVTSQSQQPANFRPISRNAQRHYSTTPEPDMPYRTSHTFHPHSRLNSQRSDNALNVYSTQPHYNTQAHPTSTPAPTSPQLNHQPKRTARLDSQSQRQGPNHTGAASPRVQTRSNQPPTPTSPHLPHEPAPNHTPRNAPTSPRPAKHKYEHYHTTQQYPTFTEAYEQYDNAQNNYNTAQQQHQQQMLQEHYNQMYNTQQYMQQQYNTNGMYPYYQQNNYGEFVQAVPRRTVPSNAMTVDLAANARTVDLSHNNSLSRNPWLEIRRSSIYDNSLPRNSEMYEYYQQLQQQHDLQQHELQLDQHLQHLQQELPGGRSLNQYYP